MRLADDISDKALDELIARCCASTSHMHIRYGRTFHFVTEDYEPDEPDSASDAVYRRLVEAK